MARPPFAPASPPSGPTGMPLAGGPTPGAMPGAMPSAAAPRPGLMAGGRPVREAAERRTLVVGRGISVQGTVQDAERLVVEGTVEATMIQATELSVAPGGMFKGEIEVEDAEIAGTIDGTLTAKGSLTVRATGKVLGTARCRPLQVEDGGQITGRIEMLTDAVRPTGLEPSTGSNGSYNLQHPDRRQHVPAVRQAVIAVPRRSSEPPTVRPSGRAVIAVPFR